MPLLRDDPTELRAIQARARAWAGVLKLPFRQQRWRGTSGDFMGTGAGSSLDFHDHRVYMPGDDPRQINWQAYARTGTYSMKLYREEVRPLVDLIFDVSESMFAFPEKEVRALELFAYTLEASLQTGASVRCIAVCGDDHRLPDIASVAAGTWLQELGDLPAASGAPALHHLPLRSGSMRIWVSDLLFPADPSPHLATLAGHHSRALILVPFATEESDPGWDGNYEFIDPETTALHEHRVEPALLRRYADAYRRHFDLWKGAALKHGVPLARVAADADFQKALQAEGVAAGAIEVGR